MHFPLEFQYWKRQAPSLVGRVNRAFKFNKRHLKLQMGGKKTMKGRK